MKTHVAEFPKHPLPHIPQPQERHPRVQPPTVFVYEKQGWEYKVVTQTLAEGPMLTQEELNALGKDGWELVSVIKLSGDNVQFYFKRIRS